MLGGVLTVVAAVVSALCVSLAWAQVRRVRTLISLDSESAARSLLRLPDVDRAGELARRSMVGSWEHALATEFLAASGAPAQIAVLNNAVAEAQQHLAEGATWPPSALRITAFSTLLLAVIALLHRSSAVIPILGVGLVGMLVSRDAMRRARNATKAQREAIDALIGAIAGKMATSPRSGFRQHARFRRRAGV